MNKFQFLQAANASKYNLDLHVRLQFRKYKLKLKCNNPSMQGIISLEGKMKARKIKDAKGK